MGTAVSYSGLLLTPLQEQDEGPWGYQLRLAEANLLSFREIARLQQWDRKGTSPLDPQHAVTGQLPAHISKHARFCPICLKERGMWHIGWEVIFADACPNCSCWLVDTCSVCHESLHWQRAQLLRCDCGHSLLDEVPSPAPENVCRLSGHLHRLAMELTPKCDFILDKLTLNQCIRIILFLGAYASFPNVRRPQKIADLDQLRVSWHITSSAAEVIFSWPFGFNSIANLLRANVTKSASGQLPAAFRGFYFSLYRGFRGKEFYFLMEAFQNYMAEFWTEGVNRRNRRLRQVLLDKVEWIPANHACSQMGISRRHLLTLIERKSIRGSQRTTEKGRTIVLVHRSDVQAFCKTQIEHESLLSTATRLGFKKSRLQALLPVICPDAIKLGELGCPWAIPTAWVDTWIQFIGDQPIRVAKDDDYISIDDIFRYKAWKTDQVGTLLNEVLSGKLQTLGRQDGMASIGRLLISKMEVDAWFERHFKTKIHDHSIPQVAALLSIKQEVAYSLVRSQLLRVNANSLGVRNQQYVRQTELESFQSQYVFCRDLALEWKTSPKNIRSALHQAGVTPVAGPDVDGCRQLLYRRADCNDYFGSNYSLDRHIST